MSPVLSGTCRSCGRPLVQVVGVRTYHPAIHFPAGADCPELLIMKGTEDWPTPQRILDVPDDAFVLDPNAPREEAS